MGGYAFLPYEGGLLDQPAWLLHDIATISERMVILDEDVFKVRTDDSEPPTVIGE